MITIDDIFRTVDEYETGKYTFSTKNSKTRLNNVDSMQYFIENFTNVEHPDIDTYDGSIVTLKNDKYNFLVQISSDDDTDLFEHNIKFVKLNIN